MVLSEDKAIPIVVSIEIREQGEHLVMPERGMRAGYAGRVANMDWLVLREGGLRPRDIVPLVLSGARPEVEDMGPQEGADDGLLEGGDDA